LTGQLDAYVDVANRIVRDYPPTQSAPRGITGLRLTGFSSYDIAAAHLIAKRAGVTITDAYGAPLDDMPLLDTSPDSVRSCVAASSKALHSKLLKYIEGRIGSLEPSGG
jgi:myo-inositol-1(or 4)-monophosphatase